MPLPYTIPATIGFGTGLVFTYFEVTGEYLDVENPPLLSSSTQPTVNKINGVVKFFPRVPHNAVLYLANVSTAQAQSGQTGEADTAMALAPITAQIYNGVLTTSDTADTAGVQLLANTSAVSNALVAQNYAPDGRLIYDVQFSDVVYSATPQVISNFAFAAPSTNSTISLTDPTLTRLPYAGPAH